MPREHTDRLAELGAFIREQRENARLSVRRLSELADVSNPYLSQIERGLRRPSAEILQQIARGLKISAETLYVRAGILDPQHHEGLEEAILHDQRLTRAQKEAMLSVYRSFVGTAPDATVGVVAAVPAAAPVVLDAAPGTPEKPQRGRR
ncbi:MAG TPA: helix-turn-helix transcriptional regulator [Acidimicrobiales bacterium]|nr:helix-turn-helix transcriptional regulator [Acidimicrobiales bacterium]